VNEEGSSDSASKRLKRAVHDLCRSRFVKLGWRVNLGLSPVEFLANPPLVDGEWIDQVAVELAEFAALLRERGIDLEVADPPPLAPLRPRRRREIPGEPEAEALSADEIVNARTEAAARLSTFTGRTREIDARPYIHLDDYRAWGERKADGDLEITEGVVTPIVERLGRSRRRSPGTGRYPGGQAGSCAGERSFLFLRKPGASAKARG
jgi:hypothetical protein